MKPARTVVFALGLLLALVGAAEAKGKKPTAPAPSEALRDASKATATAPDSFQVRVKTTEGTFVIDVTREWAPIGADRFYNLVRAGYYDGLAFFRVIDGFMAQFGIHGDPAISKVWRDAHLKDDPVRESNTRGMISFAMAGPNTRTTQLFINFKDNTRLDGMGFAPFAKVTEGMDVVDKLYKGYGEGAPRGKGPDQGRIQMEGNAYLKAAFPEMSYIEKAELVEAPKRKK
jgi:peptidyl-prolyl cis-trans isomerase A (cyclophilin A)